MAVVSHTSPLLNLSIIGELDLVRSQLGQVLIPPAVEDELKLDEGRPGASALRTAIREEWVVVERPANTSLIRVLRQDLDRGEAQALALATSREARGAALCHLIL